VAFRGPKAWLSSHKTWLLALGPGFVYVLRPTPCFASYCVYFYTEVHEKEDKEDKEEQDDEENEKIEQWSNDNYYLDGAAPIPKGYKFAQAEALQVYLGPGFCHMFQGIYRPVQDLTSNGNNAFLLLWPESLLCRETFST
jgi:hypothetical protein